MARIIITKRQKDVLEFVNEFISRNNYSPSYEDLGVGLNLSSPATIYKHLSNLEAKHLLEREKYSARSIKLTAAAKKLCAKPCCPNCGVAIHA